MAHVEFSAPAGTESYIAHTLVSKTPPGMRFLFLWGRFYANAAFQTGSVFKRTAHNWIEFYVYMRDYTVFRELIKYLNLLGS